MGEWKYRAIRMGVDDYSWEVQRKGGWIGGWKTIAEGLGKIAAQKALDFYDADPEVLYPSKNKTFDPLNIRSIGKGPPF